MYYLFFEKDIVLHLNKLEFLSHTHPSPLKNVLILVEIDIVVLRKYVNVKSLKMNRPTDGQ